MSLSLAISPRKAANRTKKAEHNNRFFDPNSNLQLNPSQTPKRPTKPKIQERKKGIQSNPSHGQ
jgi:hypothetical protein